MEQRAGQCALNARRRRHTAQFGWTHTCFDLHKCVKQTDEQLRPLRSDITEAYRSTLGPDRTEVFAAPVTIRAHLASHLPHPSCSPRPCNRFLELSVFPTTSNDRVPLTSHEQ